MAQTAQDILESVFGLTAFRGFQKDVIETVAAGGDALVLMPTGGGKSLCYQIPALMRSGMAVVVSPLIALMADQVRALSDAGVKAAYINSTLAWPEVADIKRRAAAGDVDILYVAPERLVLESTLQFLSTVRLSLFAIDEAHCVSMWGHDFRPEYAQLSVLRERWPEVPRIALTATADLATREEICERLLVNPKRFVASFDRPNIRYRIVEKIMRSASSRTSLKMSTGAKAALSTVCRAPKLRARPKNSWPAGLMPGRITPEWTVRCATTIRRGLSIRPAP